MLKDPIYSDWPPENLLPLIVYKIEQRCHFSGEAVLTAEKYDDEELKSDDEIEPVFSVESDGEHFADDANQDVKSEEYEAVFDPEEDAENDTEYRIEDVKIETSKEQ